MVFGTKTKTEVVLKTKLNKNTVLLDQSNGNFCIWHLIGEQPQLCDDRA